MRQYKTRTGKMQWMPSIEECREADDNMEGFCLACGETEPSVEPDARRYKCSVCGEDKVYGAAELALCGLVY